MERGVPIRSISRCIAVLQAVNRHGSLSLMDIARLSQLPYPTACRMIQTLMHEGLIECEPTRKHYRATALVHTLSQGFHNQDLLVTSARPFIVALTRKVGWPVAVTTRVGHSVMVRDSTHELTSLTFNLFPPGYTVPLASCASGQVYLAYATSDERAGLLAGAGKAGDRSSATDAAYAQIRAEGFATFTLDTAASTVNPQTGQTSSISVPILDRGAIVGTLSLAFFATSMSLEDAVGRYVPELADTARQIGEALEADAVAEATAATAAPARRATKKTRAADAGLTGRRKTASTANVVA